MIKKLPGIIIALIAIALFQNVQAQSNITVNNGQTATVGNFPATCYYSWTNSNPAIGLPASGSGSIGSFTAINTGNSPISGTITGRPVPEGFAYIPNSTKGTVTVINLATNTVIQNITVGSAPRTVAVSPDGNRVYIGNEDSKSISVISTATNTVIATISSVGTGSLNLSPDGSKLYVMNANATAYISVINTNTYTSTNIPIPLNRESNQVMTINADGSRIFLATKGNFTDAESHLYVVNTGNNAVEKTVSLGSQYAYTYDVKVSTDQNSLYISTGTDSIKVFNLNTNQFTALIPTGSSPFCMAVHPDGTRLYVTNETSNSVSVINTVTNTVIATIGVKALPIGISLNSDGRWLYVANGVDNSISVINTLDNTVKATIPIGGFPYAVGNFVKSIVSCSNTPITFTITVNPTGAAINSSGTPLAVNSVYGSAYASGSFNVSGTNLTTGIVVTPPSGFEVSKDDITYANTITIGTSGNIPATPVYIRLKASVAAGNYSGNVALNSTGAATVNVTLPASNITPAPLTITANNVSKPYGTVLTGGAGSTAYSITSGSLKNGQTITSVTISYGNGSAANAAPGTYTGSVTPSAAVGTNGYLSSNYAISYVAGNITVPTPAPAISITSTAGGISACVGSASASPYLQQFNVSGVGLTADLVATAPSGFQISLSSTSGFSNTLTLNPANGVIASTPIYVRSVATGTAGSITGNVSLTSTGADVNNAPVVATINAVAVVNAIPNQTVYHDATTAAINFTGNAAKYSWVNDNPGIGLAASGIGNIAPFIAQNPGNAPVQANITVKPLQTDIAYVASQDMSNPNIVSAINMNTGAIIAEIHVATLPLGILVSKDGRSVYVAGYQSSQISVINAITNTVKATVTVGAVPLGLCESPDGTKLYVANKNSNSVSVVDLTNYAVISTISLGQSPTYMAISPDGGRLYVSKLNHTVSVINTFSNTVVTNITLSTSTDPVTGMLAVSPDGTRLYASDIGNGTVVINTANNAILTTIPVADVAMFLSPDGSKLYFGHFVVSTVTNTVISYLKTSGDAYGISLNAGGSLLYAVNENSNNIDVINTATGATISTFSYGNLPVALGSFIRSSSSCTGTPATFTITVNPPTPPVPPPTAAATHVIFSNINPTGTTITWNNGNGATRAVFIKETSSGTGTAVNATTYTADPQYLNGSQIGTTGWYCVYNGTGSTITVTGLNPGATYRAEVLEYNGVNGSETYLNDPVYPGNVTTPFTKPTQQALQLTFSNTTANATTVSWTKGNGMARAVFMAKTANGNTAPADYTFYSANPTFGVGKQVGTTGWYCIYNGSGNSTTVSGLLSNNTYRVQVVEYNGTINNERYLTSPNSPANVTTLLAPPSVAAIQVKFTNTTSTTTDVSWTNGNGIARAVFIAQTANGSAAPANDISYTSNVNFGNGKQIGTTGWYCIYNGTGNTASVTGLSPGVTYRVHVVEYNGTGGFEKYLNTSASPANVTTILAPPTVAAIHVTFSNTTSSTTNVSWTNGNGTARVVFIAQTANGTAAPTDQVSYTSNINFGNGKQAGTSGWYCIYNGTGSTASVTGLTPGVTYRVHVVEYNGTSGFEKYLSGSASPANVTTLLAAPTAQSYLVKFTNITSTSADISWTKGNGWARAVFIARTNNGSAAPSDNISYSSNVNFGNGKQIGTTGWYCIYNGTGTTASVTGLTPSTTYRVHVVEYNGASGSEKYLTAPASPANMTTGSGATANAMGAAGVGLVMDVEKHSSADQVIASNILSPNADGKNDTWIVKNIQLYPGNQVTVFDNSGKTIFSAKDYANDWGGTFHGSILNEGTYNYVIDPGDGSGLVKGFITVVRDK